MYNHKQRLMRWALQVQDRNLVIKHKKGSDNIVADALVCNGFGVEVQKHACVILCSRIPLCCVTELSCCVTELSYCVTELSCCVTELSSCGVLLSLEVQKPARFILKWGGVTAVGALSLLGGIVCVFSYVLLVS